MAKICPNVPGLSLLRPVGPVSSVGSGRAHRLLQLHLRGHHLGDGRRCAVEHKRLPRISVLVHIGPVRVVERGSVVSSILVCGIGAASLPIALENLLRPHHVGGAILLHPLEGHPHRQAQGDQAGQIPAAHRSLLIVKTAFHQRSPSPSEIIGDQQGKAVLQESAAHAVPELIFKTADGDLSLIPLQICGHPQGEQRVQAPALQVLRPVEEGLKANFPLISPLRSLEFIHEDIDIVIDRVRFIGVIVIPPLHPQAVGVQIPLSHPLRVGTQVGVVKNRVVVSTAVLHDQAVIVADDSAVHHRFVWIQVVFHVQPDVKLVDIEGFRHIPNANKKAVGPLRESVRVGTFIDGKSRGGLPMSVRPQHNLRRIFPALHGESVGVGEGAAGGDGQIHHLVLLIPQLPE